MGNEASSEEDISQCTPVLIEHAWKWSDRHGRVGPCAKIINEESKSISKVPPPPNEQLRLIQQCERQAARNGDVNYLIALPWWNEFCAHVSWPTATSGGAKAKEKANGPLNTDAGATEGDDSSTSPPEAAHHAPKQPH